MPKIDQVQIKGQWRRVKSFLRFFRRTPTRGEFVIYVIIVAAVIAISLFFAHHAEKRASEKEARRVAQEERALAKELEKQKPFSPEEIQIPKSEFSFYEQLANRSFHMEGEESIGGRNFNEVPIPKEEKKPLKFELISQPSGYESVDKEIKSELALELLSVSEYVTPEPDREQGVKKKLQTGSFSSTFEANIHKSQLETMGYTPTVNKVTVNGKTVYRVQIGPFTPRDLAHTKRNLDEQRIPFIEVRP